MRYILDVYTAVATAVYVNKSRNHMVQKHKKKKTVQYLVPRFSQFATLELRWSPNATTLLQQ